MAISGATDFDWDEEGVTVIPRQPQTAVYMGNAGHVCIRQEDDDTLTDVVVLISPDHLPALIRALQQHLPQPAQVLALPAPARSAAAERQARYRDRQRNGRDAEPVTVTGDVTRNADRNGQGSLLDE
jgi:hypothetical protein